MKISIALAALLACGTCAAQVYVKPYVDRSGTYHQGYQRTAPNATTLDNYSTRGNVNPYTGQAGTWAPSYRAPGSNALYGVPGYRR